MFKEPDTFDRQWFIDSRLYLDESAIENAGIGIFTSDDIPARTIIESSPVILVSQDLFQVVNEIHPGVRNVLSDYPFMWTRGRSAIALGWGGLFNHSFKPNVMWELVTEEDDGFNAMRFRTKRVIKAGEELFVRYVWSADKLWFVDDSADDSQDIRSQLSVYGTMGMQATGFFNDVRRVTNLNDKGIRIETLGDWKAVTKKKEEEE